MTSSKEKDFLFCIPIIGPSWEKIESQIERALFYTSLLELRFDLFDALFLEKIAALLQKKPFCFIATLRRKMHGGNYSKEEICFLEEILHIGALSPTYLDLDKDITDDSLELIKKKYPEIKIILSYHNLEKTPHDLETILLSMKKKPADLYKIACFAKSTSDALKLLKALQHFPFLAVSLGEKGHFTRLIAPFLGSFWTYACLSQEEKSAEGQIAIDELIHTYQLHRLTRQAKIYALIGETTHQSISEHTHNAYFAKKGWDALYVKIALTSVELKPFLAFAKKMGFCGISVTIPFKEEVIAFLDAIDEKAQAIGSINTIVLEKGKATGYNTDGEGAVAALQEKTAILDKTVVILGAGGAARSILFEVLKNTKKVMVLNRSQQRREALGLRFGIKTDVLENLDEIPYDILINTTPDSLNALFPHLCSHKIVMDIRVKPLLSPFLEAAKNKECILVYGYSMFIHQALLQFKLWLNEEIDPEKSLALFKENALTALKKNCV